MREYKKAGVDIERSDEAKEEIKKLVETTYTRNVLAGAGPFGAMYNLKEIKKYKQPVLVSSIDGAGTKLIIAKTTCVLEIIGADLVNHCVNDILCQGAKPLFYLDYIAQDKLRGEEVIQIIKGKVSACRENNLCLIGGETAQMPDIYKESQFDVVGTILGIVEKDKIINGSRIKPGDKIIGLPSTGPHTNGYSLIRKICSEKFSWLPHYFRYIRIKSLNSYLGDALLQPHRSYLKPVSLLLKNPFKIRGIAHITGGGLPGNIVRILPKGCQAQIRPGSWPVLPVFQYIQKQGQITTKEMYQVFNMGIGMVLVVPRETYQAICNFLWGNNEPCYFIGEIVKGKKPTVHTQEVRFTFQ